MIKAGSLGKTRILKLLRTVNLIKRYLLRVLSLDLVLFHNVILRQLITYGSSLLFIRDRLLWSARLFGGMRFLYIHCLLLSGPLFLLKNPCGDLVDDVGVDVKASFSIISLRVLHVYN